MKRSRWVAFTSVVASFVMFGSCGGGQQDSSIQRHADRDGAIPFEHYCRQRRLHPVRRRNGLQSNSQGVTFVNWNGSPRSTSFDVTTGQLAVQIFASDITTANSVNVTATNPSAGRRNVPGQFCLQIYDRAAAGLV